MYNISMSTYNACWSVSYYVRIYIVFFSLFTDYYDNTIICVNLQSNLEDHFYYLVLHDYGMRFITATTYGTSRVSSLAIAVIEGGKIECSKYFSHLYYIICLHKLIHH